MKALEYHGHGMKVLEDKPKPILKELTDDVVKITRSTVYSK
jgi:alcohol dehydrogenase